MSELEPRLKLAGIEDLDALAPLVRAYHEFEHAQLTDEQRAAALRPLLTDGSLGKIWLVLAGRNPIGYLAVCYGYSIEFMGTDAFVDEFYIEPRWRGKGIGGRVLAAVSEDMAGSGVKALHLEVARSNERARSLYRAHGFDSREQFHMMSKVF